VIDVCFSFVVFKEASSRKKLEADLDLVARKARQEKREQNEVDFAFQTADDRMHR
jgi:hypothetical protein